MGKNILAYDFGTGGIKTSLFNVEGLSLGSAFEAYDTFYPAPSFHEQRPADWWRALVNTTRKLLKDTAVDPASVEALAISGHSMGVVPIDKDGRLLRELTPIWSDARATAQSAAFFEKIDEKSWYLTTGNGSYPPLHTVFKIMWYRDNEPEMWSRVDKVIGTKDYINFLLTGAVCTDYSYASGSGVYDMVGWKYSEEYISATGLPRSIFPEIVASTAIIGTLTEKAAAELGLPTTVKVAAGGVDNSCMALGAKCTENGRIYCSLGSCGWIAGSFDKPIINYEKKPYVFTHVIPGSYVSHTCINSCGTSFQWVRNNLCKDLIARAEAEGTDPYLLMNEEAASSPVGSNELLFQPALAGGSSVDRSANIRGGYAGLDLRHTRADIIRSAMEGISLNMRISLDVLCQYIDRPEEMLIVGGCGKSPLWRQIFADCFEMNILGTNIGQDAAALGAAALAAVGSGLWEDFSRIDQIHQLKSIHKPIAENVEKYRAVMPSIKKLTEDSCDLGDMLAKLH